MSNLYNLLESENISSDLKLEMLARIAGNLGEEITEEEISELDKSFNLFGHNIEIKKNPEKFSDNAYEKAVKYMSSDNKKSDHLDAAINVHNPAQMKVDAGTGKSFGDKIRGRKGEVASKVEPKVKTEAPEAPKTYEDKIKTAREANKEAREAVKTRKEQLAKIKAMTDKYKASKEIENPEYTLKDVKMNEPVATKTAPKVPDTPKPSSATKMGQAIKTAVKKKQNIVNQEVTAPAKTTKKRGSGK